MFSVWKDDHYEQRCCNCDYTYNDYYSDIDDAHQNRNKKPFMKFTNVLFHENTNDTMYRPPSIDKHPVYACPKCGTLQIDVGDPNI